MKVLMVCLGNICRSPMAEGIIRNLGKNQITVDSAGTSGYHIGSKPDSRMMTTAHKYGIDLSKLRARKFGVSDFDEFDIIFAMDSTNYQDIISLCRDDADKTKVRMMLGKLDVPDPYYGEGDGFELVYQLLYKACKEFVESVE